MTAREEPLRCWRLTLDELLGRAPLFARSAVAVGNFDGVHKGHLRILRMAVERGAAAGETPVALTFHPHPRAVVGSGAPPALTAPEERERAMGAAGIAAVVTLRFDEAVAALEPERFVRDVLVGGLGARRVVVGENFRFGRGARGTVDLLRQVGEELGLAVHVVETVRDDRGRVVSSTLVRQLLAEGDVAQAAALLGRFYCVIGRMLDGDEQGGGGAWRVQPSAGLLLPAPGKYDVLAGPPGGPSVPAAVEIPADGEGWLRLFGAEAPAAPGEEVRVQFIARRE